MHVNVTQQQIYGLNDQSIDYDSLEVPVHRQLVAPLVALQQQARQRGFELAIASGYRDFQRQLLIWNRKAAGEQSVFDSHGQALDISVLDDWQKAQAILRWSALPGVSRHHWGTDVDVYDRAAVAPDYRVQLSPEEVADSGPFGPMHQWLDRYLAHQPVGGFFRPYQRDCGGVAPERWHLSFAPLSVDFENAFILSELESVIAAQPLLLKEAVLANLSSIVERYFTPHCYNRSL